MRARLDTAWSPQQESLQRRLSEFGRQFPQVGEVGVVFATPQKKINAVSGSRRSSLGKPSLHASCMAKLFTAALISQLIVQLKACPADDVATLLAVKEKKLRRGTAGITLAHLINHAHGLDDSALGAAPLQRDGRIDSNALLAELMSAPALFTPGVLYNYGSAGAYLAGAVIEHIYARPFRSVLEQELLEPLGIRLIVSDPLCSGEPIAETCPSTGGRWLLSPMDVMALLMRQIQLPHLAEPCELHCDLEIAPGCSQLLPGWNPIEKAVSMGWKGYGADWYGHDGRTLNSSLLARINARERVALVISSTGFLGSDPVYVVLSRLFHEMFPELARIEVPRVLDKKAAQSLNLDAFTGTYSTRASAVVVFKDEQSLVIRIIDRLGSGSVVESSGRIYRLKPAKSDVFLTSPTEHGVFPYLQFIRPSTEGSYKYVWNGQNVWRRCS